MAGRGWTKSRRSSELAEYCHGIMGMAQIPIADSGFRVLCILQNSGNAHCLDL